MRTLKSKVRKKLHQLKNPFFTMLLIKYFTRKHLYVEKERISKELYQLLKTLQGYEFFSVSTTGALVLFHKEYVVKIPLGKVAEESLRKNYENYLLLKESPLKEFINYQLEKQNKHYKMERLSKIVLSDKKAEQIISKLENHCSKIQLRNIKGELFSNISQLEKKMKIKIDFSGDVDLSSSPMHGDFTKDNIMSNQSGNLVLIDLDRFTFHGIKGLDYLHYEIDHFSKVHSITFFELLLHDKYIKNKLSYLYLVYRICQEYKENITLSKEYYKAAARCLEILTPKNLT